MIFQNLLRIALLSAFFIFSIGPSGIAQVENAQTQSPSELPPVGLYLSADDYLAMKPNETDVIFQHIAGTDDGGADYFFRKKKNGKKGALIEPNTCFAASDGNTFYVSYEEKWFKAEKVNGAYVFVTKIVRNQIGVGEPRAQVVSIDEDDISGEEWYRMGFSSAERQWLPMERVKKPK